MYAAVDLLVCPPFVYLLPVSEVVKGTPVALGAQNMYHEAERRVHRRDQRRDADRRRLHST